MLCISLAVFIFSIVRLIMGYSMLNWKIVIIALFFVGGITVTSLGILGEYIGRAYMESKKRPRYNIGDTVGI